MPPSLAAIIGGIIWTWVLYLVIRHAVCAGILMADRRREQAEAERQLARAQRERQAER